MAEYTPTLFFKDGEQKTAETLGQYRELVWEGWTPGGPAPEPPPFDSRELGEIIERDNGILAKVAEDFARLGEDGLVLPEHLPAASGGTGDAVSQAELDAEITAVGADSRAYADSRANSAETAAKAYADAKTWDASDIVSGVLDPERLPDLPDSFDQAMWPPGAGGSPHSANVSLGSARVTISTAQHSAFPGLTRVTDGRLMVAWRQGPEHAGGTDGTIWRAYSSDAGQTWTAPEQILNDTQDLRDPSLSMHSGRVAMTYFKHDGTWAAGSFVRFSDDDGATWGPEINVAPTLPASAIASPLAELNGTLFAFFYARPSGATLDSVYVSRSTDQGATWGTPSLLANGTADGRSYNEPWPVVTKSGKIVVFHRYGTSGTMSRIVSTNGGSTFTAPASVLAATGRPSSVVTSTGAIVMMPRSPNNTQIVVTSRDDGQTWSDPKTLDTATGIYSTYAAPFEVAPNVICAPYSIETTAGNSQTSTLKMAYLIDGVGSSPLGDVSGGQWLVKDLALGPDVVHYGAPYGRARAELSPDGQLVRLAGLVYRTTSEASASKTHFVGTVPAGFRPPANEMFPCHIWFGDTTAYYAARVIIGTDGAVNVYTPNDQIWSQGNGRWVSLASVNYLRA